jgi:hypothetical protein
MSVPLEEAATRVVADLMPVAIVVADAGAAPRAADFLRALDQAGAGAEPYAPGMAAGFDLAILLAGGAPGEAGALVEGLAGISDRLLFVPEPGDGASLDAWFELFAEQGYQPVVEYDASFVEQGAFLVDRNATAAESELSAFAERLSMGGALAASTQRVAVLEAELGTAGDRDSIKAELAAREAALAASAARESALRDRAEAAEAECAALREQVAGWHGMATRLGEWVRAVCAAPGRDTLEALRAAAGRGGRTGWAARLLGRRRASRAELQRLADAAVIRGHALFDAGWYIACHPELAASGADPVLHYVLHGAAAGADPGPHFDAKMYVGANPGGAANPLAHAIRNGRVDQAK